MPEQKHVPNRITIAAARLQDLGDSLSDPQSTPAERVATWTLAHAACCGLGRFLVFGLGRKKAGKAETRIVATLGKVEPCDDPSELPGNYDTPEHATVEKTITTLQTLARDDDKQESKTLAAIGELVQPLTAIDGVLSDLLANTYGWPSLTLAGNVATVERLAERVGPELDWLRGIRHDSHGLSTAGTCGLFVEVINSTLPPNALNPAGFGQDPLDDYQEGQVWRCRQNVGALLGLCHRLARPASEDVPVVVKHVVKKKRATKKNAGELTKNEKKVMDDINIKRTVREIAKDRGTSDAAVYKIIANAKRKMSTNGIATRSVNHGKTRRLHSDARAKKP